MVAAARPAGLESFLARYRPALEAEMRAVVARGGPASELFGLLRYHLGWADPALQPVQAESGKRIRPALCLLACEASGGEWVRALPAAAAVELVHNFSLIHDDIEDRDATRRGRPTLWALWGEALAINAGDALFALAQLALLRLAETTGDAATTVAAARLLNRTCLALTEGQHMDIGFERQTEVSTAAYLAMIERKTAALVACACELGARIAVTEHDNGERLEAQCRALGAFGRHLGLAFQIEDDLLGIWGDPARTGKPAGGDLARRKKTLPILHGLAHSAELRALLAQETLDEEGIRRAGAYLEAAGSREYAERLAAEHHAQALEALAEAGVQGPAAEALRDLAESLVGRSR